VLPVKPANAQATFKPSVPEFTVKYVDNSITQPPIQTIHPYTGEQITQPSSRAENKCIEVSIKNQPFTPYTNKDGYECTLHYIVQYKGHFEDDKSWKDWGGAVHSNTQYATITYSEYDIVMSPWSIHMNGLPYGSKFDFRVQAYVGHREIAEHSRGSLYPMYTIVTDTSSKWSSIQTIALDIYSFYNTTPPFYDTPFYNGAFPTTSDTDSQASTWYSSTQTTVTTVLPYSMMIIILLCTIALIIGIIIALVVVILLRRHPKNTDLQPQQSEFPHGQA
jgi:hypothetical protein